MSATMSPLCTRELKSTFSFAMVPETCEPTCTRITALIVPVASTTSLYRPLNLAVKCCAWVLRFKPKIRNNPATTAAPARMSHLLFGFHFTSQESNPACSLISQRFDGSSSEAFRAG